MLERVGIGRCQQLPLSDLTHEELALAALARALVTEPRLLLLDEVTSGLGAIDAERFLLFAGDLAREVGTATISVMDDVVFGTHWPDRLALLDHGRLITPSPREPAVVEQLDWYRARRAG